MQSGALRSLLVGRFRGFYRQIVALQRMAGSPLSGSGERAHTVADSTGIRQSLMHALEQQTRETRFSAAHLPEEIQQKHQYIMVALADEIFINLDWSGQGEWMTYPLEYSTFGSHSAGEEIFHRIDTLLATRDPLDLELAPTYLLALSLGFQGMWRGASEAARVLQTYRQKLFYAIHMRDAAPPTQGSELVPQAYENTLGQGKLTELPYLRNLCIAFAVVIFLWIVLAHFLWRDLASDIEPFLDKIHDHKPTHLERSLNRSQDPSQDPSQNPSQDLSGEEQRL